MIIFFDLINNNYLLIIN